MSLFDPNPKALIARRRELGLSLEDAAVRLGLEPHQLAGMEKGYRSLTRSQARAVAAVYGNPGSGAASSPDLAPETEPARIPGAARPPMPAGSDQGATSGPIEGP